MRLLILKCSSRKRGPEAPIPVVERYDGPLWQVLRNYLREQPMFASDLTVYGLSAEYGLIPGDYLIPHYDRTMSMERAAILRPQVLEIFRQIVTPTYHQLCLGISQRYLQALKSWEVFVPAGVKVTITDGTMGEKLGQLRSWLEGRTWIPPSSHRPDRISAPENPRGEVVLSGVPICMSREEVFAIARTALQTDAAGANRFRDWYVQIDDRRVSAKWLVSLISGLPTSAFDAGNARRALLTLGVDVERKV